VETEPAVRASAVRDSLAFLDKFQQGACAQVLACVPAQSREAIETTPRSGWISIHDDHHTIDAIVALFGRARALEYWRQSLISLTDKPLLKNFVDGMVIVMGRHPATIVSLFVKGWSLAYRDLCEPRVIECASGNPGIRFDNVTPHLREYYRYFLSWEGTCQGFAHLARVRGHVEFRVAPDSTWAEAEFSWDG
jgi:hypothetical protein